MSVINFHNVDCMDFMRGVPDKFYKLAIVDPMYDLPENYLIPGAAISTTGVKRTHRKQAKNLSKQMVVDQMYFNELLRISVHQIIWGENYFNFNGKCKGRIVWDKVNDSSTFSNAEIASCSLIEGVRMFRFMWNGMLQENMKNKEARIHAYQKPVALYRWLLKRFAKFGDNILDTHGGSMSIAIACDMEGFDLDICEIDREYFDAGVKRFNEYKRQLVLF